VGPGGCIFDLAQRAQQHRATDLADQTLTPDLLEKYEVIVAQDLHSNHTYRADEVAALQAWVNAGGGFMTLIGYSKAELTAYT
jgi:hypothetical protein